VQAKGYGSVRRRKLISTENIRRAFLAEGGINMKHCFILTTCKKKECHKDLRLSWLYLDGTAGLPWKSNSNCNQSVLLEEHLEANSLGLKKP
jgi:hypothetical protein